MSGIHLVTGLPGHGKSLFSIAEIDKEYSGKRPIYYVSKEAVDTPGAGIAGLNLDHWESFEDGTKWWDCPDASVIVIDECQYIFPRRGNSKIHEPEYISKFTEHRKKGFDIYLITQDAKNIDHFIRRLANRHIHYWRPFGVSKATRWEWPRVVDPFDKIQQKDCTSKSLVSHPIKYYSAYASANIHTVTRKLPKKLLLLPVAVVLVVVFSWLAMRTLNGANARQSLVKQGVEAVQNGGKSISKTITKSPVNELKPVSYLTNAGRISGVVQIPGAAYAIIELKPTDETSIVHYRLPLYKCVKQFFGWVCRDGEYEYAQTGPVYQDQDRDRGDSEPTLKRQSG